MQILIVALVVAVYLARLVARVSGEAKRKPSAPPPKPEPPPQSVPIPAVKARKRAWMAQSERWRAAKQQQDDAEQLHAVHVDSCESKLESLRVLYEAGILDKEEYADRVIRTKATHERGARP